jgi:hypothetical protein
MSNGTPVAIRAKDKQRKQQEKQRKQVQAEPNTRWWSGKRLASAVFVLVFTVIPGLRVYVPHLRITNAEPSGPGLTWRHSSIVGGTKAALLVLGNPRMTFDDTTIKGPGEYGVIADPDGKSVK